MEFPVDSWCYLLFYINFQKLDGNLKKHFEDKHADKELPTFADLIKFLETEIRILESSAEPQASTSAGRRIGGGQSQAVKAHAAFQGAGSASASSCRLCGKSGHFIAKCEKFLEMKPAARKRQVVSLRLCFKCLNGHNIDKCTYNKNCYKCNSAKHHYLLHFDIPASGSDREQRLTSNVATNGKSHNAASSSSSVPVVSAPLTSGNPEGAVPGVSGLMASQAKKPKVLLATAIIRVLDSSGRYQEARALLDGGSESTFISESCVQRLGLERFKPDDPITGLGCTPITGCRGAVNLTMTPRLTDQPVLVTTANVLNKISYNLPGYSLPAQLADNYRGLDLADEQFFVSREIDILLGEDLLCDIVLSGRIKIHDNIPRVTKTVFGHVLSGPVNIGVSLRVPCASQAFFCSTSTDRILERFWEVEDIPFKAENPKDLECETIFRDTHSRTEEGRYSARLPFISDAPELGNTVPIAMKRFLAMERRLLAKGNEVFREKYTEFMREYAETGHMSLCEGEPNDYASGANRYLDDVRKYLASEEAQQGLSDGAAKQSITWRFNSPAAPHFGGLFEATVKSAKTLLRRVIGEQVLTFDELVTVFTRVEAVLNCRPLCPLTQDPNELEVLTPAHLLIGRPLLSVPEYNFEDIPNSRLNRFNLIQAMSQRLWRKWSEQYLHSLQMRRKWTSPTDPPQLGDLVLIKEENLPPLKWKLGRIEELLPGKDGVVRVVRLKTSTGSLTRPVVKICRLPLDD
ncbi:uncharacterized protein LOC125238208 [Leguminivora glycinivorella]|uniref:uncharacterized protein LOC125238208 n=1 Tax=Leguminivora glycinivorella TaxID=1035111 RepID=UPI00200F50F9|nr:uncharacterized protein LOC125238208 [Leguminivora glycinivorella]